MNIQLIIAASSILPFFSIGYLILKLTMKSKRDIFESLSLSLFMGASVLITASTLIGTILGSGLELLFYTFYFSGIILLIFQIIQYVRHLTINKIKEWMPSKYMLFFIILVFLSLMLYIYFPLSNPMPDGDAAEVYLPMARYFCEYDGIPAETSVYFLTGKVLTIAPGISLLQAFVFTITQSFSPMNLSFLEIAFLLCFSMLTYAFSIRCNLNKVEASLAAILMLNSPYWYYYFRSALHYIDLESAFMTGASIYFILILLRDKKEKKAFRSALPVLGVVLFATFTSKIQSLIVLIFTFCLILKFSNIWNTNRKLCSLLLFLGYIFATPILMSKLYIPTTIFGGVSTILFCTAVSLIPLIIFLRMEFREENKTVIKIWLPLSIIIMLSLYWYVRTGYVSSSFFSPIKTGDNAWAGEILKETMKWGSLSYLYTRYYEKAFNILHSIYSFTFLIPLVVGVKYFKSLKCFFTTGIKMWVLIGIILYLGVLEKAWRYPLFLCFQYLS